MGYLEYSSESTIRISRGSGSVQPPSFSTDSIVYGRVEVKLGKRWGPIYPLYVGTWSTENAIVACNQLARGEMIERTI